MGIRFCAIDSQISFLALAIASKKTSVKLMQSGRNLAQSVKLGVYHMDGSQHNSSAHTGTDLAGLQPFYQDDRLMMLPGCAIPFDEPYNRQWLAQPS